MFEHRKLNNESYDKIANALLTIDWSSLNSYNAEDSYNTIIRNINDRPLCTKTNNENTS